MTRGPIVEQKLIPLGNAASYAYVQLTAVSDRAESHDLPGVLHGVAVALCALAPVFRKDRLSGTLVALSTAEVVSIVFRRAEDDAWERLLLRESDLKAAITTLRQVRTVFGPR